DHRRQEIPIGQSMYVLAQEDRQPAISRSGKIAVAAPDDIVHVRGFGSGRDIARFKHIPAGGWGQYQARHRHPHTDQYTTCRREKPRQFGTSWSASFSPADRFLMTTRADSIAGLWDLSMKQEEPIWEEHFERFISEPVFSPNEQFLAVVKDGK